MSTSHSLEYACRSLDQLLSQAGLSVARSLRLQCRTEAVFRSLQPYQPTYLRQRLTDTDSVYFDAHLRGQFLAEVEVYAAERAANPATVYLRLLKDGQYVLQQEMAHWAVSDSLARYFRDATTVTH